MTAAPRLRTVLDLGVAGTQLVDSSNPLLDVLMLFGRVEGEQGQLTQTAVEVRDLGFGAHLAEAPFTAQVYVRRLAAMAPASRYSAPLAGLVSAMCGGNPARAVLWAHATAAYCARHGRPATVQTLVLDHMDGALPTEAGLRGLWEGQKIPRDVLREMRRVNSMAEDNYLDHKTAWTHEALLAGADSS